MKFKATVFVKLRGSVSDAPGNAVMNNTHRVSPNLKSNLLRIGKCIDYWFEAKDYETAEKELYDLSDMLLANTVVEDWSFELAETEETGIGSISNDNAGTSKHSIFD
jgi:phosphoribosylformylglycinamidine synthase